MMQVVGLMKTEVVLKSKKYKDSEWEYIRLMKTEVVLKYVV